MTEFSLVPEIADFVIQYEHVGSRVTCDPLPAGADDDWLVLVPDDKALYELDRIGFGFDGSMPTAESYKAKFWSMTRGELNLIVTDDPEFYRRFSAATYVAKKLNLLRKEDRVSLFQAVLYGNKT